jgi:hypothetical protein
MNKIVSMIVSIVTVLTLASIFAPKAHADVLQDAWYEVSFRWQQAASNHGCTFYDATDTSCWYYSEAVAMVDEANGSWGAMMSELWYAFDEYDDWGAYNLYWACAGVMANFTYPTWWFNY